jgi:CDP-6-deoxy-D-xylo-4-hexulose-3-dehydrase
MEKEKILEEIKKLVKDYFSAEKEQFIPGQSKIPLQVSPYGWEESNEAIESILTTWVTMGKKVKAFEELFANYLGIKYASMVNSGSSANLLALSILTNPLFKNKLNPGDEVITPATTWITTIYPIANVNLIPMLVDIDIETLNINTDAIEKAINEKTRAIMPVHLLGNPCDIKRIMEIAEEHDLYVIEDTCEAHGAEIGGRKAGTFGDMATFSFFFSHHITTIEGGMLVTNNEDINEMAKSMRVFGWVRDLKNADEIANKYSHLDRRFLFSNIGYNFRPTEIQGAFGMHQIKKLDDYIKIRQENAKFWNKTLSQYPDFFILHEERPGTKHVWFGFPITIRKEAPFTRNELTTFLESKKIETRPIEVPNAPEQPGMKLINYRVSGSLDNSDYVLKNSFFIGNHQAIGKEGREFVVNCINDFIQKRR